MKQYLILILKWTLGLIELGLMPWTTLIHCMHQLRLRLFGRSLQGKVVLITGASSGIGAALAQELHGQGCRLILAARDLKRLEGIKKALIANAEPETTWVPSVVLLDVSWEESKLAACLSSIVSIYDHVDIVVNNAGVSMRGSVADTPLEAHRRILEVNYFGVVAITRELLPTLSSRPCWSSLVNISSLQGLMAVPNRSAYSASKHALQAFSDSLRAELAASEHSNKVEVLVVSPGYVQTNLSLNALTPQLRAHGHMDATTSSGYPASYVALCIREALQLAHKEIVVAPWYHNLAVYMRRLVPNLYFAFMAKRALAKETKDVTHTDLSNNECNDVTTNTNTM